MNLSFENKVALVNGPRGDRQLAQSKLVRMAPNTVLSS